MGTLGAPESSAGKHSTILKMNWPGQHDEEPYISSVVEEGRI